MRMQSVLFSIILALSPATLLAGGNHDHGHSHSHEPVSKAQAEQVAIKSVAQLIENGKIDSSWKSAGVAKSEQKQFGSKLEWVISFANDKISDPKQQTLYVFVTLTGEYLAANYTGK